jgi:hypothetical protein
MNQVVGAKETEKEILMKPRQICEGVQWVGAVD